MSTNIPWSTGRVIIQKETHSGWRWVFLPIIAKWVKWNEVSVSILNRMDTVVCPSCWAPSLLSDHGQAARLFGCRVNIPQCLVLSPNLFPLVILISGRKKEKKKKASLFPASSSDQKPWLPPLYHSASPVHSQAPSEELKKIHNGPLYPHSNHTNSSHYHVFTLK